MRKRADVDRQDVWFVLPLARESARNVEVIGVESWCLFVMGGVYYFSFCLFVACVVCVLACECVCCVCVLSVSVV